MTSEYAPLTPRILRLGERRVADNIRLKLTDKLTEMKVRDLEDLGRVIQGSKELLRETPPKSWEGVAERKGVGTDRLKEAADQLLEAEMDSDDKERE